MQRAKINEPKKRILWNITFLSPVSKHGSRGTSFHPQMTQEARFHSPVVGNSDLNVQAAAIKPVGSENIASTKQNKQAIYM